MADGGTLFLDEVSEMTLGMQAKLLRVLEGQSFRRVGGVKNISVDVRVIVASNRNLEEAVRTSKFRQDLYFRLAIIPVHPAAAEGAQGRHPRAAASISSSTTTRSSARASRGSPKKPTNSC